MATSEQLSKNKKQNAILELDKLVNNANAKYIIFSYNNEGIIGIDDFQKTLSKYGNVKMVEQKYNAYRGSRNLNGRDIKIMELLWILKKN